MPENAAHELVMMQGAGLFSLIPLIGILKSDALIGIKLDLMVLERTAFDITGQVSNDPLSMRVGLAKMRPVQLNLCTKGCPACSTSSCLVNKPQRDSMFPDPDGLTTITDQHTQGG